MHAELDFFFWLAVFGIKLVAQNPMLNDFSLQLGLYSDGSWKCKKSA
jgi:hypothetical protein